MGLGLSICQKIAADHDGALWLEPTAAGALFVCELPVRSPPTGEAPVSTSQTQPVVTAPVPLPPALQNLFILIVEDDPAVVGLLRRALGGPNRLSIVGNGRDALARCAIEPFDLILCDLKMPVMSGPEFYERLLQAHPDLAERVVFISGDTTNPATRTFLQASGRPLLAKPFTLSEVYAAIARV
jgi:CheY-like chemotaxis protein